MTMNGTTFRSTLFIAGLLAVLPANAQPDLQLCARIENNTARLACYDELVQTALAMPGLVQAVLPVRETMEESPDFEATVTTAVHRAFTGWIIDFDNGQRWRQAGTASFVVRKGDICILKSNTPDSFLLQCGDRARRIQVTRIE